MLNKRPIISEVILSNLQKPFMLHEDNTFDRRKITLAESVNRKFKAPTAPDVMLHNKFEETKLIPIKD